MKNFLNLCKHVIPVAALMCLWACSDDDFDRITEATDPAAALSVEEAQVFFEEELMRASARFAHYSVADYAGQFMLPLGEIVPEWEKGIPTRASRLQNMEAGVRSTWRYYVIQTDPETGESLEIPCYHKLLVVKDPETGEMGSYIVFFIPTNEYAEANEGANISERLYNNGNMGDFSGLKIYTSLDGRIIRVNEYVAGSKTKGVYLDDAQNIKEYTHRMAAVLMLTKNMAFLQETTPIITTRWGDRGSSTEYYSHFNDSDSANDWLFGGSYFDFGNGLFYDSGNNAILTDNDGDGKPDSVWIPDINIDGNNEPDKEQDSPDPGTDTGDDKYGDNWESDNQQAGGSKANDKKPSQKQLDILLKDIYVILKKTGIRYEGVKIIYVNAKCFASAQIKDGKIEVCNTFFGRPINDQASIIWHELDHIRNRETKLFNKTELSTAVNLIPPASIENHLRNYMADYCKQNGLSNSFIHSLMTEELRVTAIAPAEYYENEVRCYEAEKKNGISISDIYNAEREFLLWKSQQLLNITNNK